ncbi:hypothetical protein [Streptomyces sp. NPDC057910]|uniref:hypothetical protein n=1 Tax=Streptomyces sp. NPDC057910 TaxID=3346278 RepID=UPI0036EDD7FC
MITGYVLRFEPTWQAAAWLVMLVTGHRHRRTHRQRQLIGVFFSGGEFTDQVGAAQLMGPAAVAGVQRR